MTSERGRAPAFVPTVSWLRDVARHPQRRYRRSQTCTWRLAQKRLRASIRVDSAPRGGEITNAVRPRDPGSRSRSGPKESRLQLGPRGCSPRGAIVPTARIARLLAGECDRPATAALAAQITRSASRTLLTLVACNLPTDSIAASTEPLSRAFEVESSEPLASTCRAGRMRSPAGAQTGHDPGDRFVAHQSLGARRRGKQCDRADRGPRTVEIPRRVELGWPASR